MNSTLPTAAIEGFALADHYDAHRPSYPAQAVSALLSHMGLAGTAGAAVVEIGSGTGKFTQMLANREERFDIVAVEPHDDMRRELESKTLQRVRVVEGHASNMPVEEGWGDGCIAAQAFHWFASTDSLGEIQRVLRPGAHFGMIWNIESYNQPPSWPIATTWEKDLNNMMMALDDGHGRFRHMRWMGVFDDQKIGSNRGQAGCMSRFSLPIGADRVEWTVWLEHEQLWNRLNTLSQLVVMNKDEKTKTRAIFDKAMMREDCIKNDKGQLPLTGCTYFAWTQVLSKF